ATARFRLVKCPKCRNLLTEFANVPVYKCGGCGATLRAKHSIADVETDAVGSVDKIPESISFEVSSLEKQMNSHSSDSKDRITEERSLNLCSSDRKIETPRPDESSEHQKIDTETRDLNAKRENPDRKIQVEEDECLNKLVEKSPKITRKEEPSLRLSDRMNMSSRSERSTANDDRDVRAPKDHNRLSKSAFTRKVASDRLQERVNMDYAKQMSLRLLRKKILIKVDELRDELDELFDKSAEERIRTRQITTKHQPSVNTPRMFRYTQDPIFAHRSTNLHSQSKQFGSRSGDHSRERMHKPKEHFRPVLGGAPFVICHNCSKLLTLPTDLLASQKQLLRKLKCGSCSQILTFSYREGTHSSHRAPDDVAHPNSEVSSAVDVGTGSDAFDSRSFGISFSTEAEIAQHVLRDSSSNLIDKSTREGKQVIGSQDHQQISRTNVHVKEKGAKDEKGKGILIDY
ncbi:Uncharacterized protein ACMD2_12763, partial [Ananas comosus]